MSASVHSRRACKQADPAMWRGDLRGWFGGASGAVGGAAGAAGGAAGASGASATPGASRIGYLVGLTHDDDDDDATFEAVYWLEATAKAHGSTSASRSAELDEIACALPSGLAVHGLVVFVDRREVRHSSSIVGDDDDDDGDIDDDDGNDRDDAESSSADAARRALSSLALDELFAHVHRHTHTLRIALVSLRRRSFRAFNVALDAQRAALASPLSLQPVASPHPPQPTSTSAKTAAPKSRSHAASSAAASSSSSTAAASYFADPAELAPATAATLLSNSLSHLTARSPVHATHTLFRLHLSVPVPVPAPTHHHSRHRSPTTTTTSSASFASSTFPSLHAFLVPSAALVLTEYSQASSSSPQLSASPPTDAWSRRWSDVLSAQATDSSASTIVSNRSASAAAGIPGVDVVDVEALCGGDHNAHTHAAPQLILEQHGRSGVPPALSLSVLHYARPDATMHSIVTSLVEAARRQFELVRSRMMSANNQGWTAFHFAPPPVPFVVTLVYPTLARRAELADADVNSGADADVEANSSATANADAATTAALLRSLHTELRQTRLVWHRRLRLPVGTPMLRVRDHALHGAPPIQSSTRAASSRLCLSPAAVHAIRAAATCGGAVAVSAKGGNATSAATRLFNVHAAASPLPAALAGAPQYLVRGSYAYYHYMQDGVNDSGWGCAYRTLQTICSWYIYQMQVSPPPTILTAPTHADVQRVLVALDDKPPSFVNSREWIGAIEVSHVLRSFGIDSRILFVASGREVPSHARQLATHFATHGTPVMIGGGVLAYGLLGVAWSERTGKVRFLILDPHYTGQDANASGGGGGGADSAAAAAAAAISKGGWCAWKEARDVFRDDVFYNFCLPQRAVAV